MPKVSLSGGAYQARSVIASAQRSLNLYSEPLPQTTGEQTQWAHYPTPGLTLVGTLPQGPVRAIKQTTTGDIYAVGGSGVYYVNSATWEATHVGDIAALRTTPVSMQDNGETLFIVDGTVGGWTIDLAPKTFAPINDPAFYGADRVDFLDTFILFNKPLTPQFYWTGSNATTFDPEDFANKESFSDILISIAVAKREIWLLGERTTEIWADVGQQDISGIQFQPIQGVFVDHGCRAKFSVVTYDNAVYWLSYDRAGLGIVLRAAGYLATRISTSAIEAELAKYTRTDDAIGFTYSLWGHAFYVLTFPSEDHTWVYDITTGQWHEWLWIDADGVEHRHRANCAYACNGLVVCGDHDNGNLYLVDPGAYTDNCQPIKRVRSFPHIVNEMNRVYYRQLIADVETGTEPVPCEAETTGSGGSTPYTAPRAQINTNAGGLNRSNTAWGFPVATNFSTLLMSYWMCGPYNPGPVGIGSPSIWPVFNAAEFFAFSGMNSIPLGTGSYGITLTNLALGSNGSFYTATMPAQLPTSPTGCLQHFLLSIDTANQIAQLYVNDQPVTLTGSWAGGGPYYFNISNSINIWAWDVSGVISTGNYPAIADAWISNTPAFIDLSITANRRKFINPDLTGVDLGATGTNPFGYQPAMYMAVRSGDPASAILTNRGLGGGTWGYSQNPPTIQAPGACILPTAPTPPPPGPTAPLPSTQIFLEWSDDRGHSFGNPVGHAFGEGGHYLRSLQWQRLGYARDRVFRISWSVPNKTALLGAYIEVTGASS